MIKVILTNITFDRGFFLNRTGNGVMSLQVEGHAGLNKKGEDIVCSAVSALAQTAVLSVTMLAGIEPDLHKRDGYIKMTVDTTSLDEHAAETIQTILGTFVIGITEIVKTYPRQVHIEFKEENT